MTRTSKLLAVVTVLVAALTAGSARAGAPDPYPIPYAYPEAAADDQVSAARPYDPQYLFVVTREMRDSSGDPAMVVCLAPLTLTVDVFLLPIEALLGFLG